VSVTHHRGVRASPEVFRTQNTIRIADEEIASTRVRAIERAHQLTPGTQADRRIRKGGGFVEAGQALTCHRAHDVQMNILIAQVLTVLGRLPEGVPIGTVMSRLATVRAALAKLK
jgi:RNA polymerase sigma-70 factor (ECF subfamily)